MDTKGLDIYCLYWDADVRKNYYCVSWEQMPEGLSGRYIKDIDFKPTVEIAVEAERAREWAKEHNRGHDKIDATLTAKLIDKEPLTEPEALRMASYFDKHKKDKEEDGFKGGDDGFPNAGRIAWGLWGGDHGMKWSTEIKREILQRQ